MKMLCSSLEKMANEMDIVLHVQQVSRHYKLGLILRTVTKTTKQALKKTLHRIQWE